MIIRPQLADVAATDFQGRHLAVLEGEKAAVSALPDIRRRLTQLSEGRGRR